MGVQEPVPSCSIWVALQDSPTNGQIANRKDTWIKLTFLWELLGFQIRLLRRKFHEESLMGEMSFKNDYFGKHCFMPPGFILPFQHISLLRK
jgi:hypothetical protein